MAIAIPRLPLKSTPARPANFSNRCQSSDWYCKAWPTAAAAAAATAMANTKPLGLISWCTARRSMALTSTPLCERVIVAATSRHDAVAEVQTNV